MLKGISSLVNRRPALVGIVGVVVMLLTPFAFFPEIMGDVGVTDAGTLRNARTS